MRHDTPQIYDLSRKGGCTLFWIAIHLIGNYDSPVCWLSFEGSCYCVQTPYAIEFRINRKRGCRHRAESHLSKYILRSQGRDAKGFDAWLNQQFDVVIHLEFHW